MAYIVMSYIVMAEYGYGLYSYGLYGHGLNSYGLRTVVDPGPSGGLLPARATHMSGQEMPR